jgi:hypothetical protein
VPKEGFMTKAAVKSKTAAPDGPASRLARMGEAIMASHMASHMK